MIIYLHPWDQFCFIFLSLRLPPPVCPVCLCADTITSSEAVAQTHYNGNNTRRRVFLCFTSSAIVSLSLSLCAGGNLILVKKGNKISNAQHHLAPAMCDDRRGRRAKKIPGECAVARSSSAIHQVWQRAHTLIWFAQSGAPPSLC
jgi:hypothetical protein